MKKSIFRLTVMLLLCALCAGALLACGNDATTPEQPGNGQTGGETGGQTSGGETPVETPASKLTFELNEDEKSYTVTGLSEEGLSDESLTELVIPATYQGLQVTSIGEEAFAETSLTSVTIGNSVTSIGYGAFAECYLLASVTLGKSVESIDQSAFEECNLTSIVIPDSVTSIREGAFDACYKLVEVYNLSRLTVTAGSSSNGAVGYYAKVVHTSLDEESILHTTADGYVFCVVGENVWLMGYTGTDTALTLPDNYDGKAYSINDCAFYERSDLTSVIIPDGVTSIGEDAFHKCTGLTSLTIPDSVTSIENVAFVGCTGLTSVTIGNSVTSIGDSAFEDCYKLVEVYNLSSLTITTGSYDNGEVGYYAKVVHTSLAEESILHTSADGYVFCVVGENVWLVGYTGTDTALTLPGNYDGKAYGINQYAFYERSDLTSVIIPDGVTSIGYEAFGWCDGLTSVTIPNSVTSIEYNAFEYCWDLTSVTFANTDGWYITKYRIETSGTSMIVTNASINATNLRSNYTDYYWKRNG